MARNPLTVPDTRRSRVTDEHLQEAARLRELWNTRPGKCLSQAEFGEKFDIGNQSAIAQFLHGRTPLSLKAAAGFVRGLNEAGHRVQLRDISPRLQATADQLVLGVDDDEFVDVPRTAVSLSAGSGREPHVEELAGSLKFRARFLRDAGVTPGSARIVDVSGRSMEPTIPDGAVILVSRANREPRDRQIFALRIGEELFVKRLVIAGETWLARSDNEDREQYPDIVLTGKTDVEILGRAVWMGARL